MAAGHSICGLRTGDGIPPMPLKTQRRTQWAVIITISLCIGTFLAGSSITEYAYLRTVHIGVAEKDGEYDRIGTLIGETFSQRAR